MKSKNIEGHNHDRNSFQSDMREPEQDWEFLEIALRELLIEKNILSAKEIQDTIQAWEQTTPANGAKMVAKAWTDEQFRHRLLSDGNAAAAELGFKIEALQLVALQNTEKLHHLVVCTLCSCYPRAILGIPPLWYKSREYRARAVREPRAVLKEFGTVLPESTEIRVVDSTADCRYLVIPRRPLGSEGFREEELQALVGRDSMIGTAEAFLTNFEKKV